MYFERVFFSLYVILDVCVLVYTYFWYYYFSLYVFLILSLF